MRSQRPDRQRGRESHLHGLRGTRYQLRVSSMSPNIRPLWVFLCNRPRTRSNAVARSTGVRTLRTRSQGHSGEESDSVSSSECFIFTLSHSHIFSSPPCRACTVYSIDNPPPWVLFCNLDRELMNITSPLGRCLAKRRVRRFKVQDGQMPIVLLLSDREFLPPANHPLLQQMVTRSPPCQLLLAVIISWVVPDIRIRSIIQNYVSAHRIGLFTSPFPCVLGLGTLYPLA